MYKLDLNSGIGTLGYVMDIELDYKNKKNIGSLALFIFYLIVKMIESLGTEEHHVRLVNK